MTRVMGHAAVYTHADTGATEAVTILADEFIGAIDDTRRAVFVLPYGAVTPEPKRGDYFVLSGETDRWYLVNLRNSLSGDWELRCEGRLERL
ncbi:MAG: hypothetical protein KF878_09830 [Planctomycetes bacterium]|nr:hypothetical protein [Planctomycetota bacterium]